MELLVTTLTPAQRLAGVTRVRWSELADQQRLRREPVRVLGPGDEVLLHDGDYVHSGRVLRHTGWGQDGAYVVVFGAGLARQSATYDPGARVIPLQRDRRTA